MRVLAFTCGWLTGPLSNFLQGEEGRLRAPVPCYLIDHPRGKVLFDTGLHRSLARDPAGRLGFLAKVFDVEFGAGEVVSARLAAVGIDPGEVRFVVNSHLHFDHVGGNAEIPDARIVVQRPEWQAGHDPRLARRNAFDARDYDTGHDVLQVSGEHDLFGDGRVVCVPTYGHTPGHQSLLVRAGKQSQIVCASDACYTRENMDRDVLPKILWNPSVMFESLKALRKLRDQAGATMFYGHDPAQWETIPKAPAPVI